ncbi:hypothetical protein [Hymenobacter sp. GOD-10R]|uniref:hypothetical protein n=1 Tax=Hymenobacter sp. GOD-10R TaxID=3093922 RepID=UPI002D765F9E|nr:hypothetical protein [Hymenobacter sp. GOD-10R]WRQ26890.1 hypothetical protein SD425_17595 [Hymenobacter sp. GOD-10R]
MVHFLTTLVLRNAPLYYFGWVCLVAALVCAVLTQFSSRQVMGVNAWGKPAKFFISISLFAWTMGWYLGYLGPQPAVALYTWVVVGTLAFELLCITGQAARGQRSHFNTASSFGTALSIAMGVAIVVMTLWTAYIGLVFGQAPLLGLPPAYAWAIRLGIGLFVVFALQGGLMVSRLAHTVGGPDGGPGLPGLGWSTRHGDLRVAHFIGMHALQVLPLLAWYGQLSVPATGLVALLYASLAGAVLVQALRGRALGRRRLFLGV